MNAVSAMLVAYACIMSPAFACETLINHKPDRFNITEAVGCPPTYVEALEAAARSIDALGKALEKNVKRWDELNQTLERLNKHIDVAPAAAVPVKKRAKRKNSRKVKLADRCGSQRAVWRKLKNGHRKYRCV